MPADASGDTSQLLERAEANLKNIDLQIAKDPTNAMSHWRRAVALAVAGDLTRARESLEKAIALLPRYAEAWAALGEVHARTGNRASAKHAFRVAVGIEPLTKGALAGYRVNASSLELLAWRVKTAVQERSRKRRRHTPCLDATQTLQEAVSLGDRGHIAVVSPVVV